MISLGFDRHGNSNSTSILPLSSLKGVPPTSSGNDEAKADSHCEPIVISCKASPLRIQSIRASTEKKSR